MSLIKTYSLLREVGYSCKEAYKILYGLEAEGVLVKGRVERFNHDDDKERRAVRVEAALRNRAH